MGKLRAFWRYPLFVKAWFAPAWCLLGLMRLAIMILSFRRLVRQLGREVPLQTPPPDLTDRQTRRARLIGQVVRLAAAYTPWESNCFPQALCASLLLRLYGLPFVAYLGLMREPGTREVKAHAWVAAGGLAITGGVQSEQFTVVGAFARSRG